VTVADEVQARRLHGAELRDSIDGLAAVLADCVAGGASVSYMAPFTHDDAVAVFEEFVNDAENGNRIIVAAFAGDELVGTAQVLLSVPPNQPHRADIAKVLVHRAARKRGIGRLLMEQAEHEARAAGKSLLVLDTVTGGDAERLYERLGWNRVGVIPGYALFPDGRLCDTTVFWKTI
jgi:GNAT superfamily N-acetyltransferase